MPERRPTRPLTALGALTTAGGLVLFTWWIRRTGLGGIREGFAQIGWGLAAIVLLGGFRFALRACAWMLCMEPPHHLTFRQALGAVIAGDALGNLLPLGPLVSEPTKAAFVRGAVPLAPAVTALAIENVLYTLSVAAMIGFGMGTLLFHFSLPPTLRILSEAAIGLVLILVAAAVAVAWTRPALLSRVSALIPKGLRGSVRLRQIRTLENRIYTFGIRRPRTLVAVVAMDLAFHALGVLEAYITVGLLLDPARPVAIAIVLETVNRLITVAFKFIPGQAGVNEAGTALLTGVLGLGTTVGTTIGLVRKVRLLCWTAAGTGLLIRRGLSVSGILADPQLNKKPT